MQLFSLILHYTSYKKIKAVVFDLEKNGKSNIDIYSSIRWSTI